MLKITARQVVAGMGTGLLAGLLVAAFELDFPEEICEYEHNQTPNHDDCTVYSIFPFFLIQICKTFKALNDYGAGITGIATVFLVMITAGLVYVARVQIKTTRAQLRAYVGVTTRDVPNLVVGQNQAAGVFYTNYGKTPANKMRYWGDVRIREHPLRAPLPSLNFRLDVFVINPSQKIPIVFETINQLTAAEETAVRAGTSRFYLYGEIEYFDSFKERRTTTFRFSYGGVRLIGIAAFTMDEEGNAQN